MKIFYLECTEEELKANRGIMDAIVDMCQGLVNTVFGTTSPAMDESEEEDEQG